MWYMNANKCSSFYCELIVQDHKNRQNIFLKKKHKLFKKEKDEYKVTSILLTLVFEISNTIFF